MPVIQALGKLIMSIEIPPRDGDGYLLDMDLWSDEIGKAMASDDGVDLDEDKWNQVLRAREYFEDKASVPPIRKFAKFVGIDKKDLFNMWMTGPMKPISKYGGLPKPTGCV